MKNSLKILITAALALTFVAQIARADNFDDINNENQEGKIIAALNYHKESILVEMESALKEIEQLQEQVGNTEDSGGRLRALGEMIDLTALAIEDSAKLDAELDENYEKLDHALEDVQAMRAQARELAKTR